MGMLHFGAVSRRNPIVMFDASFFSEITETWFIKTTFRTCYACMILHKRKRSRCALKKKYYISVIYTQMLVWHVNETDLGMILRQGMSRNFQDDLKWWILSASLKSSLNDNLGSNKGFIEETDPALFSPTCEAVVHGVLENRGTIVF